MVKKFIAPLILCMLFFSLLMSFFNSCKHDSYITQLVQIKFNAQILPIFQNNCAIPGCHNGKSGDVRLNLSDYNHIIKEVVPGKPYSSRVYNSIIDVYGNIMPPGRPLSEQQRMLMKVWIEQGAKNNDSTTVSGCDTNNVNLAGKINKILNDNCLSCHSNANAQSLGAGIKLQDSADVVARHNRLLGSVEHLPGYFAMPLGLSKLDTCKIIQISIWLRKLNLKTTSKCDTNNVTFAGILSNILNYNCLTCHSNANAQSLGAGIKLQDSVDVVARPRLLGSIEHLAGYYDMPLGQSKLDTCYITQFAIWFRKLHIVDTTKPRPPVLAGYACFSRDILPIIKSSCSMAGTNCHNGSGEESFPLTNYNEVRQILIPGHPTSSSLYVVITNRSENFMPPSPYSPLPQSNIDSIYSWIMQGATNATCTEICDTNKFSFTTYVYPIIQTNCKGCHTGSSAQKGVRLEDYATISSVATSGQLVKSITGNGSPLMPSGNQLSNCNIRIIEKWASAGAPNNK